MTCLMLYTKTPNKRVPGCVSAERRRMQSVQKERCERGCVSVSGSAQAAWFVGGDIEPTVTCENHIQNTAASGEHVGITECLGR